MFEWLSNFYLQLIVNFKILFVSDMVNCYAVDRLHLFSGVLLGIFGLKVIIHHIIFWRLRHKFPQYSSQTHPAVITIFKSAAQALNIRRLPELYQFQNSRPLVFTIGTLKPAIFLAPALLEKLRSEELEAVLLHELNHVKRRDTFLVWLLELAIVCIPLLIIQFFGFHFAFSGPASDLAIWVAVSIIIAFRRFFWRWLLVLRELSCDDGAIKAKTDPLVLASAIVNVARLALWLPKFRWQYGLAFAQTLLPQMAKLEMRAKRLLDYRRPRIKHLYGKLALGLTAIIIVSVAIFLWRFHSMYGDFSLAVQHFDDCTRHVIVMTN